MNLSHESYTIIQTVSVTAVKLLTVNVTLACLQTIANLILVILRTIIVTDMV